MILYRRKRMAMGRADSSGPGATASVVPTDAGVDNMMRDGRATRRAVLGLAVPVIVDQVLQTVTQMADMIMVGRLGAEAVAAVGLSTQPFNIAQAVFMGIGVGATALVARFIGAQDRARANRIATQALFMSMAVAAVMAAIGYVEAPALVRFMGAAPEVVPGGIAYMRILMPGLFMLVINMVLSAALRGAGDTRFPMKVNAALNVANIIGNYILIYGNFGAPAMGVAGAALATTLSRVLGTVMLIWHVRSGHGSICIDGLRGFRFDFDLIKRILNVGIAASAERVSLTLGLAFYVRIVAALGTIQYAAHAVALNAEAISYMPAFAFAVSATTMVGQALGADRPDFAERAAWECWRLSTWMLSIGGALLLVFPQMLMKLYVDDPQIVQLGAEVLRIMAFVQVPMGTAFVMMGALRGAGDTRSVLFTAMFSVWVVRLGLAWLFVNVFGWGLPGAWYAMGIDWLVRMSIATVTFRRGRWRYMSV